MTTSITTNQVWHEVEKQLFAVMGMVTARGEPRTAGVVYVVRDQRLYVTTGRNTWKAKHIARDPHVSLTVTIPKRIPFMPWMKIPAATISFQGEASVHGFEDVDPEIPKALLRGLEVDEDFVANACGRRTGRDSSEPPVTRRGLDPPALLDSPTGPRARTAYTLGPAARTCLEISNWESLPRKSLASFSAVPS
jgi:hypothetical protein